MNHELIEILKAFVLRDNGHEGLYELCSSGCDSDVMECTSCLLIKGWSESAVFKNMYLENTLRNLNEPGTIIHTQSIK
ncbi:MAG: hypothetical protein ACRDCE_20440 [Cetobacterium sp.]|uniref:hypothetical protein n=1 Tax=Cetobacterium sp. TaxID=2071632 RepID=UPI003EE58180